MMFDRNMRLLKGTFPDVWQRVLEMEKTLDKNLVRAVSSKEGNKTLKVEKQFIHDKKNFLQEAKDIIEKQINVEEHSDIIFYGLGLGYQIDAFVEKYPQTAFTIYEPVPEVFYQFLCHVDLQKIPRHLLKNICIENKPEDLVNFCGRFVAGIRSSVMIIDLPAYKSIFPEKRQAFFTEFERHINERRISLATNSAFEKRWTTNSMKNFNQVLKTPDILLAKKDFFKNQPAIMVASGPSLEEEIENLREIREKGLAYIFSVGTALNTLVQHEIYPNGACTYDPTEDNQIICKEVLEKGINSIPLIFGSTVGYESLEKYPGPKMHVLINQDTLAAFYLKPKGDEQLEFISDATTIAVISIQLLARLGFNPIILVGQNLAYRDNKIYNAGATFHPVEAGEQEMATAPMVKDVHGNEIASSDTFIRMRQQMEIFLSHYKDSEVINTTKYGAHIEGTRFQSLDELINDRLHDRVVEDKWMDSGDCSYDWGYLLEQSRNMTAAYEKVLQLIDKCKLDLNNINDVKESKDPFRIGQSYDQFNLNMDKLRNNQFFASFITPMTRVELEKLMLTVPQISAEMDPIIKAQMMEKEFRAYLLNCEQDIQSISILFQEMNQSIQHLYKSYIIQKKSAHTKILLIDCDGILTDGAVYYAASGDELRKFNFKDRLGIRRLQEKGINTLLINSDKSPAINNAAKKLEINTVNSSNEDLTQIIINVLKTFEIDYTELACLFNDLSNLKALKQVGLSFAVRNASQNIQQEVDYILPVDGGEGVIMAIANLLLADESCSK